MHDLQLLQLYNNQIANIIMHKIAYKSCIIRHVEKSKLVDLIIGEEHETALVKWRLLIGYVSYAR
jgi:hypothetical protein